MRETAVEKKLIEGAYKLGYWAPKFVSPGNDGVPDRLLVGHGRVIFVELKTETGKLSPVQRSQIARLNKFGQSVRILYGADDVDNFLRELKEGEI